MALKDDIAAFIAANPSALPATIADEFAISLADAKRYVLNANIAQPMAASIVKDAPLVAAVADQPKRGRKPKAAVEDAREMAEALIEQYEEAMAQVEDVPPVIEAVAPIVEATPKAKRGRKPKAAKVETPASSPTPVAKASTPKPVSPAKQTDGQIYDADWLAGLFTNGLAFDIYAAAKYLGRDRNSVEYAVARGRLRCVMLAGKKLFAKADLDAYAAGRDRGRASRLKRVESIVIEKA